MAFSTPKFSFQSTPKNAESASGLKVPLQGPKPETIQNILNYSKALEARKGENGDSKSYVLN